MTLKNIFPHISLALVTLLLTVSCRAIRAADPDSGGAKPMTKLYKLLQTSDYGAMADEFVKVFSEDPLHLEAHKLFQEVRVRLMRRVVTQDETAYKTQARSFVRVYEVLCEKHPNSATAHYLLGRALFLVGDLASAKKANEKALTIDVNFPPALLVKALLMKQEGGDIAAQKEIYTQVVKLSPSYAGAALNGLASVEDNPFKAIQFLKDAVKTDPLNNTARLNLAKILVDTGDYETALSLANEALKQDPEVERAHLVRGYVYLARGKKELAIDAFSKEASLLTPYSPDACFELGKLYAAARDWAKAKEKFEWVVRWSVSKRLVEEANSALKQIESQEKGGESDEPQALPDVQ